MGMAHASFIMRHVSPLIHNEGRMINQLTRNFPKNQNRFIRVNTIKIQDWRE